MERSFILAGFGGQGLLFAGQVLARAAMAEGKEVLWIPSYGPEMRGGTASCTVIIGDDPIGSPVLDRVDVAVVLNPPSLARYEPFVAEGGLLVVNTTLIEAEAKRSDVVVASVPCTALAREAGDDKLTCVVALGAVLARVPVISVGTMRDALTALLATKHPEFLQADLRALELGFKAGEATPSVVVSAG